MRREHVPAMTAALLAAAAICGTVAGCTTSTTKPPPVHTSPSPSLPPFPSIAAQDLLVKASAVVGHAAYTSRPLTARGFVVELGCVGPAQSATQVQIYQNGPKPIFQIQRQPCDTDIQKINIIADTLTALRVDVTGQTGTKTSLLITQR